ncbi:MAG: GeoRSP system radical SAM/SPASM protein [bacterium]|nr:MAG: GeoRSP system radical SAM/SPASM protein [bacterium]
MKRNDGLLSAPLTINWSLSYDCNFSCSHCYSRDLGDGGLPREEIFRIADLLAAKGVMFVNFGGGEPLVYGNLFDVAAYASGAGLKVTMNSNGFLLERRAAAEIARAGFHSVGISIDSPVREVHDRFRNMPGSFDRALAALDHLREAGVPSTVSCVVNRLNVNNWDGMIALCSDHGAETLYLHNYKCTGMGLANMGGLDLSPEEWGRFYAGALEIQRAVNDITISFDDPIMAAVPGHDPRTAVPGSTCGKLSLHLKPNGDLTPCGFIPVVIGNILEDELDDIWFYSPVLQSMRAKTPQGKCDGCESYKTCLGGCTARVFALTGTFDQPDPHCWIEEEDRDG